MSPIEAFLLINQERLLLPASLLGQVQLCCGVPACAVAAPGRVCPHKPKQSLCRPPDSTRPVAKQKRVLPLAPSLELYSVGFCPLWQRLGMSVPLNSASPLPPT